MCCLKYVSCSHNAQCRWLIAKGITISFLVYDPLQDGASPLHAAALRGHLEVVRALLKGGADVKKADKVCAFLCLMACTQVCQSCHELYEVHDVHDVQPNWVVQELQLGSAGASKNTTSCTY